jgi:hypothetical protein
MRFAKGELAKSRGVSSKTGPWQALPSNLRQSFRNFRANLRGVAMSLCMSCGRPLPERRCGVVLPPFKAAIFDAVARAGGAGISTDELVRAVYVGRSQPGRHAIKVHVFQMNARLAGSGSAIVSEGRRWYLRRVEAA